MSSSREEDPVVTVVVEDEVGSAVSGGAENAAESSNNNNSVALDIPSSIMTSSMDHPNLAGAKDNNGNEQDGDFLLKIAEMRARGAPVPNQPYHPTDDDAASTNWTQQKLEKAEDNEVNELKIAMGVAPEKVSRDNQAPVMVVADPAIREKSQLKVTTKTLEVPAIKEVQVYILLGQSNMLGMGHVGQYPDDIAKDGTLQCAVHQKGLYPYLLLDHNNNTGDDDWKTSSTVRNVRVMDGKQGQSYKVFTNEFLTIHNGSRIGPEVGMGHVLEQSSHDHHNQPVMLLKSCIGNRSLGWDLLPPGSRRYVYGDQMYAGYKDSPAYWPKDEAKPDPIDWYAGKQYDSDVSHCQDVLANHLETYYPGATTYKVVGFFWWQGDKDRYTEAYGVHYEANLVRLIHQLRADFKAPDAKFVLATLGQTVMDDTKTDTEQTILKAMMAVDGNSGKHPEHLGNVATVYSHPLSKGGASNGHYNGNAETYMNVGEAMGQAMAELVLHQEESQIKLTTETPILTGSAAMLNIGTAILPSANQPNTTSDVPAPPPPLTRGQRGVQSMNRVPGAEAVYPDISRGNSQVTEPSSESLRNETSQLRPSRGGSGGNDGAFHDEETLFVATLVDENSSPDHENVLVEAKPAFDGFKAIVRNKRFKYVVALFVLLVLSVAIPVGLLLKKEDTETRFTTVNGTLVCGARGQRQTDYRGTTAITATGLTCQAWSSQSPWTHDYKPELYPSQDLGGHNFCRNPTRFGKDQRAYVVVLEITSRVAHAVLHCLQESVLLTRVISSFLYGNLFQFLCVKRWCYTTDPDIRWA